MDARQLHLYEHAENGRAVALAELVDRHPTLDLDWLNPEGGYETALGVAALDVRRSRREEAVLATVRIVRP